MNEKQNTKILLTYLPHIAPAAAGIVVFMMTQGSTSTIIWGAIVLLLLVIATIMTYKLISEHAKLTAENEQLHALINDKKVFVDIATSASMPKFIINSDGKPYWTNIESKDYDINKTPEQIVEMLVSSPVAAAAIEKCLKRDLIATYETEMGAGDQKISLNITLSKIKYKNDENAIYGNITNTSEHQRELSMQAEMLSLITAQMEATQTTRRTGAKTHRRFQ